MSRMVVLLVTLLVLATVSPAGAEPTAASSSLSDPATSASTPVFLPGADPGGAGVVGELDDCRLVTLCVEDSECRELWPDFWACVWQEGSQCDSLWCEYGY